MSNHNQDPLNGIEDAIEAATGVSGEDKVGNLLDTGFSWVKKLSVGSAALVIIILLGMWGPYIFHMIQDGDYKGANHVSAGIMVVSTIFASLLLSGAAAGSGMIERIQQRIGRLAFQVLLMIIPFVVVVWVDASTGMSGMPLFALLFLIASEGLLHQKSTAVGEENIRIDTEAMRRRQSRSAWIGVLLSWPAAVFAVIIAGSYSVIENSKVHKTNLLTAESFDLRDGTNTETKRLFAIQGAGYVLPEDAMVTKPRFTTSKQILRDGEIEIPVFHRNTPIAIHGYYLRPVNVGLKKAKKTGDPNELSIATANNEESNICYAAKPMGPGLMAALSVDDFVNANASIDGAPVYKRWEHALESIGKVDRTSSHTYRYLMLIIVWVFVGFSFTITRGVGRKKEVRVRVFRGMKGAIPVGLGLFLTGLLIFDPIIYSLAKRGIVSPDRVKVVQLPGDYVGGSPRVEISHSGAGTAGESSDITIEKDKGEGASKTAEKPKPTPKIENTQPQKPNPPKKGGEAKKSAFEQVCDETTDEEERKICEEMLK